MKYTIIIAAVLLSGCQTWEQMQHRMDTDPEYRYQMQQWSQGMRHSFDQPRQIQCNTHYAGNHSSTTCR